jgi:hypothetical protein
MIRCDTSFGSAIFLLDKCLLDLATSFSTLYKRHMDIVYKKGVVNHADAMSRRLDVKDSLNKLQLLRDWTNDDAKCELHAQLFPLESRLHPDSGLHAEIKTVYDSDIYLLTRKSLPTWMVR